MISGALRRVGLRPLFIVSGSAVVLVTLALLGGAMLRDRPRQLQAELIARGASTARMLAALSATDLAVGDEGRIGNGADAQIEGSCVWVEFDGTDGRRIYGAPTGAPQPWRGVIPTRLTAGVPVGVTVWEAALPGERFLIVEAPSVISTSSGDAEAVALGDAPARAAEEVVGKVVVVLTTRGMEEALAAERRLLIGVTAGVMAVGLGLAALLSTVLVSPVLALAAAARRIAEGGQDVRVPEAGAREILEVNQAFNHMARSLRERDQALRENAEAKARQAQVLEQRTAELEAALAALERGNQELRLSQDRLRATNAELLHHSRLKSEFLASMSHELRTPLNSIIGYTECLLDGLDGPINAEQTDSLGRVQRNGRHLLGLINDILDLSKIESGKMELALADLDLAALTNECVGMVRPLTRGRVLTVSMRVDGALPRIRGDAARARQILINLLSNAVKFTPEGEVEVVLAPDAGGVSIAVRDTGVGIPADSLEEIFLEFRQLGGPGAPGTGLGLAITRRLVELMEGTIKVRSEVGAGTTFTVWLPRAPGETGSRRAFRPEAKPA